MSPETPFETPAKSTKFDNSQPDFTFWDALRRGNAMSFEARSARLGKVNLTGGILTFSRSRNVARNTLGNACEVKEI